MNGLEQRARQTAVEQLHARLDDLGLIVERMAVDSVQHRDELDAAVHGYGAGFTEANRLLDVRLKALEMFRIRLADMTLLDRLGRLLWGFPDGL